MAQDAEKSGFTIAIKQEDLNRKSVMPRLECRPTHIELIHELANGSLVAGEALRKFCHDHV
jgi:hypothetical protein